ncbi:MAG: T9SS type A sorting domain-containing protein, partial [Chitinophagales bacterium]
SVVAQIGTSTSFNITGLEEGTQYYVYIQPYTICSGVPDYSYRISTGNNKLDTTTLGGCPEPNSVTGINITNVSATSVTINYNVPVGGADGYVILQGSGFLPAVKDSTTYTVGQTVIQGTDTGIVAYVGTDTSVTISGLNPNTHYEFVVFAYDTCSYGPNYKINFTLGSNKDSITTPLATAACVAPTSQPTILTFSNLNTTSFSGSFVGNGASGYVVLYSTSSTAPTLVDGVYYTTGQVGGATVVSSGNNTSFNISGLTANTLYYVFVYAYNNTSCTGGPAYNNTPLTNDTTTLSTPPACVAPSTQATNISYSSVTANSINGSFIGNGSSGYVVLYSTSPTVPTLIDASTYTIGQTVGTATVVQSGTSTSFNITGLTSGTRYYIFLYAYNNTACVGGPAYNMNPTIGDTSTLGVCIAPSTQPTTLTFNNIISTSFGGSFIGNAANGYVVLYSTSSTAPTLTNGVTYTVGQTVGSATVVQSGASTSFNITGLTASTTYYVYVFAYNNTVCTGGPAYNIVSPLSNNTTTSATTPACVAPSTQPTAIVIDTITNTNIRGHFTGNGSSGYIVLYSTSATAPTLASGTPYTVGQTVGTATVAQSNSSTMFDITGLTAGTTYYIYVFAYNNIACVGGPAYNTVNPLSATRTTITSTGIKSSKNTAFSVYPNPVSNGIVNIQFKTALIDDASLTVVDVLGRVVTEVEVPASTKSYTLPVENYSKGMYIINVRYKNENSAVPFIVE